jgi:nucleotide-binding universal stress UspA family protein
MKVLVPVEDKVYGQALVDYIAGCKWSDGTVFQVFHVLDPARLDHYSDVAFIELLEEAASHERAAAEELVATLRESLTAAMPNATVEWKIVEGYPKEEVLKQAHAWTADLIVIGSHGRNAVQRLLLGSVSMGVLGAAPCSVLLVRSKREAQIEAPPDEESARKAGKMHVVY